jgi:hypothetical protein
MGKLFGQGYGGIFRVKQFDHFLRELSPFFENEGKERRPGPFFLSNSELLEQARLTAN